MPNQDKKIKFLKSDLLLFYTLFVLAVYFVYRQPQYSLFYFLFLSAWAWFSKKNYFWIAFFFLLLQTPAYFFSYTLTSQLPFIKLFAGAVLTPIDLFTILMLIKVLFYRKRIKLNLKVPLILLGLYFSFSFFIGSIFYSRSLDTTIWFFRPVFYTAWIIFFVGFMETKENIFKFFRLLFPIVFLILFSQLYFLGEAREFIALFDPYVQAGLTKSTLTGELRPVVGGVLLVFLNYIGALFFLQYREKIIGHRYLYLIATVSFFSIFISATRSWFGIFLFIAFGVFFRKIRNLPQIFIAALGLLIIAVSLIKFGLISSEYLQYSAWGRVSQLYTFISGQGAEIDTFASRLEQSEPLLRVIGKALWFGYGFSEAANYYYNNNLGFLNTILMFGLVGFLFFLFLFTCYIKMIRAALRRLNAENPFRDSLKVLLVAFCAMLIGYLFTWDFFSPYYSQKVAFVMVFFGISEVFLKDIREG